MSRYDDEEPDEPEPLTPPMRRRPMIYEMPEDQRDTRREHAIKRVMAPPMGVPVHVPQDPPEPGETTRPWDLFTPERAQRRRRGDSAAQLAAKLREERPDPYDLIAQLAFEHVDVKEQERSASRELDKQFKAFLAQQPGGAAFDRLKRSMRFWKWAIGLFLIPALGALAVALQILISNAVHEGERNTTIRRLESDVQLLLNEGRNHMKDNHMKDNQP